MAHFLNQNVRSPFKDYVEMNARSWKGGPNPVPYSPPQNETSTDADQVSFAVLVSQAKHGLAAQLGIPVAAIDIRIQG